MSKVKITCDSTCDLTKELYERYNVSVIALGVNMGEDSRLDGVNVQPEELYSYVAETGKLPSTNAISIGSYEDFFKPFVEEGYEVVHINLSSELSCSHRNAKLVAEEMGNVYPVDSLSLSTGSGHLVVLAAELAAADYTAAEIAAALEEMKGKLDVSFVLQTLDYLHKGGRCSSLAMLGANLLKLRPEIVMSEGKLGVGKKYRGSTEKSVLDYVKGRLQGAENLNLDRIFITHSGISKEIEDKVVALVKELQPFEEVFVTKAGSTISCHCGPECLGVLFMRK